MNRFLMTFFLIILGSISIFAQGQNYELRDRDENYTDNIELQCYNTTNSYAEYKRCVENSSLPICSKSWERGWLYNGGEFPCRYEADKEYWDKLRQVPIEKYPLDFIDGDKKEKLNWRQLPNEKPESFEPPFPTFTTP